MPTTKTTITITDLQDAAGNLLGNAWLTVRLNAGGNAVEVDGVAVAKTAKVQTDADGDASIQLYPNEAFDVEDTFYTIAVDETSPLIYRTISVPTGGGTYAWTADAIQVEAVPFDGPYPGGTTGSAGQVVARKSSGNGFELVNHNSIAGRSTADAHPMAAVSATGLTVPKASTIVAEWEATAPAFGASSERIAAMSAVLPLYVTRDGSTAAAAAQDQHAFGLLALAEAEGARTDLAELADTDVTVADPPALFDPTNAVAAWESLADGLGITAETTDQVSTLIDGALTLYGRTVDHQDDVNENAGVVGLIGLYVGAQALDDAAAAGGGSVTIDAIASATHGATSKTTPVDADELPIVDSAAGNGGKKLTWANLKTALASIFTPQTRTIAGLDLSADRSASALKSALSLTKSDVGLGNVTNDAQVALAVVDAKGDLLVGTAADTIARLAAGANGRILLANSSETNGMGWYEPSPVQLWSVGSYTANVPNGTSAITMVNNRLYVGKPFVVRRPLAVDRIGLRHDSGLSSAGSVIRIGLATASVVDGIPTTRYVEYGTIDPTSAASPSTPKAVTISDTLPPGIYYPVCVAQFTGTAPVIYGGATSSNSPVFPGNTGNDMPTQSGVSSAIPSSLSFDGGATVAPVFYLRPA